MRERDIGGNERASLRLAECLRPSCSPPSVPLFCVFWDEHHSIIVSFLFFPPCLHKAELITPLGYISHLSHSTKCVRISVCCPLPLCAPTPRLKHHHMHTYTHTHLLLLDTPLGGSGRSLWFTGAETPFPVSCATQSQTCFLCHFPFLWRIEGCWAF